LHGLAAWALFSRFATAGIQRVCGVAQGARVMAAPALDFRKMAYEYEFYVYILSSRSRNLYTGFTAHLRTRVLQHREKVNARAHTARYEIHRLVYFERFQYVNRAIARENEIKSWTRAKKVALIVKVNPTWVDLAADW
jgi:putative endonuclease